MKKFLAPVLVLCVNTLNCQSLPPTAQALYNEMYNADVNRGQFATTNGAQTLATADGNSFYLKWLPPGATGSTTPMLVSLHGSNGNAFNEFYLWHARAQAKGVGIIALQWYRGAASVAPNDYFDDPTLYTYIDTALKRLKYPSGKVFLHGFSRGSARSYALAFYDVRSGGKNYFCTILSNAGKPDSAYQLYTQINGGTYGHSFYTGKKWAMFCGGQDPNPAESGCTGMSSAKNWVIANGANVGLYISDPNLSHGGFHQTVAYIDSALNYYLQCFNTVSSVSKINVNKKLNIFPNPAGDVISIENANPGEKLKIITLEGLLVYETEISSGNQNFDLSLFAQGIYFISVNDKKIKLIRQ